MRLKDKVAIITGGARGIGKATAELFSREGAKVIIWDLLDTGEKTAQAIQNAGGTARFMNMSTTDKSAILNATKNIIAEFGKIDILINNAGITRDRSTIKMNDEEWQSVIDVNLTGVYHCTKAVVPHMKEAGYGRIISASSTSGMRGNYGQANYAATKAGVVGMTKTWALEFGKFGITANAIAPGYTNTAMTDAIPDHIRDMALMMIPVGFIADPIDIAYGYLYLASDEARFVNGVCLNIDGGSSR